MIVKLLDKYEISKSLEYSHLTSDYIVSVQGHYKEVADFGNSTNKRYFGRNTDINGITEIIFPCKTYDDAKHIMECAFQRNYWGRVVAEFTYREVEA